jgi:NADPH-dependent curcumin reductase
MNAVTNRRIVLAARPRGAADLACFRLESVPLAALREGEVLLRSVYLSLDPYMRGRMSDAPSYAPPVAVGAVMTGQTVSVVAASRHPDLSPGDRVLANSGWQEYEVSTGHSLLKLSADIEPPSYALGVLGMPGFTAFVGLLDIGKPKPGETLVVAAATGAVGSVVGQIAKLQGCRVVGIAGGAEKCAWAVHELGFDDCIDHRSATLDAQLASACPGGVDIYYENVGGKVFRAVLPLLNAHARIPVCGLISQYNETPAQSPGDSVTQLMRTILVKRLAVRGFIISDGHEHRRADFLNSMVGWLRAGKIKYREHVVQGLESAPEAFLDMLAGRNFGKTVVALGPPAGQDAHG